MKKIIGIIIVLIAVGGLVYILSNSKDTKNTSQTPDETQGLKTLGGTSWVYGKSGKLSIKDGRYSATVGCNIINGEYKENGNTISFEAGASTLMACPDLQKKEDELVEVLSKTNEYKVTGNIVTLIGDQVSLDLSPLKDSVLTGTEWNISSIKENEGNTSSISDEVTFLVFNTDGTFSGKSACNNIMGSYELKESNLSFSDIGSTKMLCSDEENAREQVLITSLSKISQYTIEGNTLILTSSDKEYSVQLSAK